MKFLEVSIAIKVAFLLACLALLFIIIGFATPAWYSKDPLDMGLWEYCANGICIKIKDVNIKLDSQFEAAQAMTTLGFIASLVAVIVIMLHLFVPPMSDKEVLQKLAGVLEIVGGILVLIGVIIFATIEIGETDKSFGDELGYSAILSIVGAIFNFVAGALFLFVK